MHQNISKALFQVAGEKRLWGEAGFRKNVRWRGNKATIYIGGEIDWKVHLNGGHTGKHALWTHDDIFDKNDWNDIICEQLTFDINPLTCA